MDRPAGSGTAPDGRTPLRPPPARLRALEAAALFEAWVALPTLPILGWAPRGDGHPVLVIPGFTATDDTTWYLRRVLRAMGYSVHRWRLGRNIGPHADVVRGLRRRLDELADGHGRAVSIVGWSLGGIYARELARAHPDRVRMVVTLGSPFRMRAADASTAQPLYRRLAPRRDPFAGRGSFEHQREPVPVPTTSVYTRTDGVVRWHACIDTAGSQTENVEVYGTHSGLGFNSAALFAAANRLAQPEGAWRPFQPPLVLRHLYPAPASWERRWDEDL